MVTKLRSTLVLAAAGVLLLASCSGGGGTEEHGSMPAGKESGAGTLPDTPTLTPTKMGDVVMSPGVIVTPGMEMNAMRGMAAVDPSAARFTAPAEARGAQPLSPEVIDGVKEFRLETSVIRWNILPTVQVLAYAFNRQVPGPLLRVHAGDRVRMVVTNNLPDPTTVHWHGLVVPNEMDGAADVTQAPIPPGGTFRYEFTVDQPGSFFYHSHFEADRQEALGLYGPLVIDSTTPAPTPRADQEALVLLQEWTVRAGYTFPAMPMEGLMPNFFTINGKAFPSTETVDLK